MVDKDTRMDDGPLQGANAHVPELDGIRGIAVLLVLVYHFVDRYPQPQGVGELFFFRISQAGWVGVELFFVLSGYLITGILADTRNSPRYFTSFYGRRSLRIFPLYYAVLILYFWVGPIVSTGLAAQYAPMREHQAWFWLYASNWLFATTSQGIPGLYFWSLAVEEQFYLIWPWVVWLMSSRKLMVLSTGLVIASLGLRLALLNAFDFEPVSVYFMTFTHMEGLSVGAFLAIYSRIYGPRRRKLLVPGLLGLACLGTLIVMATANGSFPYWSRNIAGVGYTLLALLFGSVIMFCLRSSKQSLVRRFFNYHCLRISGKYSYALYLLHIPISNVVQTVVFDRFTPRTLPSAHYFSTLISFILVSGICSFAAAIASWHLFEKRLLSLKRLFPY